MSIDRNDVESYLDRMQDDADALAELRLALDKHRKHLRPGTAGPSRTETDAEVIVRLASTVDRYDQGVKDALEYAAKEAGRERSVPPDNGYGAANRAAIRIGYITPADVAAYVGRRDAKLGGPYIYILTEVNQHGETVPPTPAKWTVGIDPAKPGTDHSAYIISARSSCRLHRGCDMNFGHKGDHKVRYPADWPYIKIPPHAAITDTPQGRMATWYESNRGAK